MHNIYSLQTFIAFSYMFWCHIHHYQGKLMCPLLKTICYVDINCGFYGNYIVNYV